MNRRHFAGRMLALLAAPLAFPARAFAAPPGGAPSDHLPQGITPLRKSKAEWRRLLAAPAYAVLFEEDTERSHSSPLNAEKRAGTFVCAACQLPLFTSRTKYESGTGWPSFTAPLTGHVATKRDFKIIVPRTEYHCARCGGHQGHVFDDGPRPAGLRYCNNGLALQFVPAGQPLPTLRA